MVLAMGPDNLDYLDRSWVVLASEESDDFFGYVLGCCSSILKWCMAC